MKVLTYDEIFKRNPHTYRVKTDNPQVQFDPITEDYEIVFEDGSWVTVYGPHRKIIADSIVEKLT